MISTTAARGLVAALHAAGGSIRANGAHLRATPPAGGWTVSLLDMLRRHKPEILAALAESAQPATTPEQVSVMVRGLAAMGVELAELDHLFERRAILEFDAHLPRAQAELRAAAEALERVRQRQAGGAA